ncbi:MAG: stage III sporulation AC/AD family protein [Oscillospiraceae bacterium]|nr:stage III sporulation AC/AD family protein [Oscillospiraceae bacterium]
MNIITVCGFGILAVVLCLTVRQIKPDMAVMVGIAAGIVILGMAISALIPSVNAVTALAEQAGIDSSFAEVLIKALAVCYITTLSADCARDAGEAALGAKLEIAGRVAIAGISLPVFTNLASLVTGLLS